MEENSLHRTDVVPTKRSTALRMKTAGRCMCMESGGVFRARELRGVDGPTQIPDLWTRGGSACRKPIRLSSIHILGYCTVVNPNLLVPLSSQLYCNEMINRASTATVDRNHNDYVHHQALLFPRCLQGESAAHTHAGHTRYACQRRSITRGIGSPNYDNCAIGGGPSDNYEPE